MCEAVKPRTSLFQLLQRLFRGLFLFFSLATEHPGHDDDPLPGPLDNVQLEHRPVRRSEPVGGCVSTLIEAPGPDAIMVWRQ